MFTANPDGPAMAPPVRYVSRKKRERRPEAVEKLEAEGGWDEERRTQFMMDEMDFLIGGWASGNIDHVTT
jgi:hypothetical protein